MSFIFLIAAIFFPFIAAVMICRKQNSLRTKENSNQLRVFLEGCKIDSKMSAMFNVFFMVRRLAIAISLVTMCDLPYFQCVVLLGTSFVTLLYVTDYKPLKKGNFIEIFNETFIYLSILVMTCLMNSAWRADIKELLGWILIAVAGGNILANTCITAY